MYPLLGKGYSSYAYGSFKSPYGAFDPGQALRQASIWPLLAIMLLALGNGLFGRLRWRENSSRFALVFASLAGTAVLIYALNGFDS
jgi:hypothetical protein